VLLVLLVFLEHQEHLVLLDSLANQVWQGQLERPDYRVQLEHQDRMELMDQME